MSTPEQYDALIIGSGEAGKYLSWHLGSQGKKVANIEDKRLGGACPNIACLPSKNVIYSAKVVSLVDPKTGLGVTTGPMTVDMAGVAKVGAHYLSSIPIRNCKIGQVRGHAARLIAKQHVELSLETGKGRGHSGVPEMTANGNRAR